MEIRLDSLLIPDYQKRKAQITFSEKGGRKGPSHIIIVVHTGRIWSLSFSTTITQVSDAGLSLFLQPRVRSSTIPYSSRNSILNFSIRFYIYVGLTIHVQNEVSAAM